MKPSILSLLVCCLFLACQNEGPDKSNGITAEEKGVESTALRLQTIEAQTYLAALQPQAASSIERLCEESKGYRTNEWPGLNECDWAIEQQLLEKDNEVAHREDQTLFLKLANGEWFTLLHEKGTYYQYKAWLKNTDHFLILINQSNHCHASWLINRKDGSKQRIEGLPYFSEDGMQAIVTSAPKNTSNTCNSQLELWQYQEGQFSQLNVHSTKNRVTEKLFWKGSKEVLLRQSTLDSKEHKEHYAKIDL